MDVQDKINQLWDGAAADYDATPSHGMHHAREEEAWRAAFLPSLPPVPADILDVGTGTGVIAVLLAGMGHRVTGIDLSPGMLAQARAKSVAGSGSLTFETGDALSPAFGDGSFDAVVNRHVLWTMTDPALALANWRRVLRRGGRLVVVDGLWGKDKDERIRDISPSLPLARPEATLEEVRRLVSAAGFADGEMSALSEVDRIEAEGKRESTQPHYMIAARNP